MFRPVRAEGLPVRQLRRAASGSAASRPPTRSIPPCSSGGRTRPTEIYKAIPDFGGFTVKANSEGQPGPQDYKRTHADGANLLADAVKPHGGIVMWRAFVYDATVDPDRVKRAYKEFVPLDGTFRDNVFVQTKNGPLDFMPREPFHPLFGAMPKTPNMAELQITQEYLGHSTHLVYLAPMWKEFFDADTFVKGPGSTVAKVADGTLQGHARTGIAGVANTGSDRNWSGHHFAPANWYAFGRLAWNPALTVRGRSPTSGSARRGPAQPQTVRAIKAIMLGSREAFVNYTMPLGLHHLIGGDHYAVMPENNDPRRLDWTATYYHKADAQGVGFDRTRAGSGAVDQYAKPLADRLERSDDDAGVAAAVVPPPAVGLQARLRPDAVAGDRRALPEGRRRRRRRWRRTGRRSRARSTTSGTPRSPPSCGSRRWTPPRGATSASPTSRSSAGSRSRRPRRRPPDSEPAVADLPAAAHGAR